MQPAEPSRRRDVLAGLEALDARTVHDARAVHDVPGAPATLDTAGTSSRLRAMGPLVALLPPLALGVASLLVLRSSTTAARGVAGFVLAVLGAPLLVVVGIPLRTGPGLYAVAILGSTALWALLGLWAGRRAARRSAPGWASFWGEYTWMALAVWIGVGLSLLVSNLVVGRVLI